MPLAFFSPPRTTLDRTPLAWWWWPFVVTVFVVPFCKAWPFSFNFDIPPPVAEFSKFAFHVPKFHFDRTGGGKKLTNFLSKNCTSRAVVVDDLQNRYMLMQSPRKVKIRRPDTGTEGMKGGECVCVVPARIEFRPGEVCQKKGTHSTSTNSNERTNGGRQASCCCYAHRN